MKAVPCIWPVDCRWSVVLPSSTNLLVGLLFSLLMALGLIVFFVVVFYILFVVAVVVAWAQMPRLGLGPHVSEYF